MDRDSTSVITLMVRATALTVELSRRRVFSIDDGLRVTLCAFAGHYREAGRRFFRAR